MGCESCASNTNGGAPAGCRSNGACTKGCGNILDVYDWLANVYYVDESVRHQLVEVRFKGTRKGFYRNVHDLPLDMGQAVVVEAAMGGHDVGHVSLIGPLVKVQMKKYGIAEDSEEIRKIYRLTTPKDIEKWEESKSREYTTMMKSRVYARELGLEMKISDVEFQGDNTKATFYYTADGRVDFRELIKVYARNFKIKVEMRQIGLRQEAGRLGGIGSCGRELCCSTWLTDFTSVPTTAARYQNLFLNPLKLSGQCGRLKCCLNYELDTYMEALEDFPDQDIVLKTAKGEARSVKTDILKRVMYFVYSDDPANRFYAMDVKDVKALIEQNKTGDVIEEIDDYILEDAPKKVDVEFSGNVIEDDLDRFEKKEKKQKRRRKGRGGNQQKSTARNEGGPNRNKKGKPRGDNKKKRETSGREKPATEAKPKRNAPNNDQKKQGSPRSSNNNNNNSNKRPSNRRRKGGNNKPRQGGQGPKDNTPKDN